MTTAEGRRFHTGERGDRTKPPRHHRAYWHLTLLLATLEDIARSELLTAGGTILDFGCGNKPYQQLFTRRFARYIGADLPGNPDADVHIDAHGRVAMDDATVDCVLSTEVLEHTDDPRAYLLEAYRVVRPGGFLILSAPAVWVYHPDPIDYWRWTIAGLQAEIRRPGFEIVLVRGVFGPESTSLQLWQDATMERLPRRLQSLYTGFIQWLIGQIERRRHALSEDASIYVVVARKPQGTTAPAR